MLTETRVFIHHVESSDFIQTVCKPLKMINEYLIVKTIGKGSFSKVHLAIDQEKNIPNALKRFCVKDLQKVFGGISQIERDINSMNLFFPSKYFATR